MKSWVPSVVGVFALALLRPTPSAADSRWIRLQSSNFEVYSTASADVARDALKQFEQLREFFYVALGVEDDHPRPVRIVAFSSPQEYQPYGPTDFAVAHYQPGDEHDTIVMSLQGTDVLPVAAHEYFHLVANHAGFRAPLWLSEGLAEVYSTLRSDGNAIRVGDIIPRRLQALRTQSLVPLSVLVGADRKSPYYNEKNPAGSLYNQAWALTHMLAIGDAYRARWPAYLAAIQSGKDSAEALTATYGKSLDTIERDLRDYVRGDRFSAGLYPLTLQKPGRPFKPVAAPDFDVKLLLVDLGRHSGAANQTRQQLQALAAEYPARPEPFTQLGYLAWQTTGIADAEVLLEKAFARGERNPQVLWDYGRMAARSRPEQGGLVLRELLALEPARRDARIELAAVQFANKQPSEAIATLGSGPWQPDEAPRVLSIVAAAQLALNNREAAKIAAERVLAYTPAGQYHAFALQLLGVLNQ